MLCHYCNSEFVMPLPGSCRADSSMSCFSCGVEGPLTEEDWSELVEESTQSQEVACALREAKEGSLAAIQQLKELLDSAHPRVSKEAALALGCLPHEEAVRVLYSVAKRNGHALQNLALRQLGNLKLTSAAEALVRLANKTDPALHADIKRSLAGLKEVAVVPVGLQLRTAQGEVLRLLEEVLERINTESAKQELTQARIERILRDVAKEALTAVEAGDRIAVLGWRGTKPLIQALENDNPLVRVSVTRALIALGGEGARVALQHARLDEDPSVADLVEWAIEQGEKKGKWKEGGW